MQLAAINPPLSGSKCFTFLTKKKRACCRMESEIPNSHSFRDGALYIARYLISHRKTLRSLSISQRTLLMHVSLVLCQR